MIIRKAKYEDIDAIMNIINMAQIDMKSQNINQWQKGYPNHQQIKMDIDNGVSFVLTEDKNDIICATIVIAFIKEKCYEEILDGNWTCDCKYGVIHRIAVNRSLKGKGLANKLIEYACDLCKINQVPFIRVDTHKDNVAMQKLLLKNGFKNCGIIYLTEEKNEDNKRIAFDKKII